VERDLSQLEIDVAALRIGQAHEAAEQPRRAAVVGDQLAEGGDVLGDAPVGQEPEPDRVEGVLGEAEEVGVDLVGLRDFDQVEVRLPVDRRFRRPESNAGRARERARPKEEDQRGEKPAAPDQTLSFSLRWQELIPLSPAVMAFANSA
jgi:hypothetical protein